MAIKETAPKEQSQFLEFGNVYTEIPASAVPRATLRPGVYRFEVDPRSGQPKLIWLSSKLRVPKSVFGSAYKDAERILTTYKDRASNARNTGMLCYGPKGSGKTLLSNIAGNMLIDMGGSVVQITEKCDVDLLVGMLSRIDGPKGLYFDEFEKTHPEPEDQYKLLNAMSGGLLTGTLIQFMVNNFKGVNDLFKDRPDRVFYTLPFDRLDPSYVREYCAMALGNKDWVDDIVYLSKIYPNFTADLMCSIVEESNRYKEHPYISVLRMGLVRNVDSYSFHIYEHGEDVSSDFYGCQYLNAPLLYSPTTTLIEGIAYGERRRSRMSDSPFGEDDSKKKKDAEKKETFSGRLNFNLAEEYVENIDPDGSITFRTKVPYVKIVLKSDSGSVLHRIKMHAAEKNVIIL